MYYIRYYAVALILLILRDVILGERFKGIIFKLLCSIPQLLMLGQLGFNSTEFDFYGYYVSGSWYLSALFILFLVFFPLMIWNYSLFMNNVAPVLFMFSFSLLITQYGKINVAFETFMVGHAGLIRATCELCIGCIIYEFSKRIKKGTRLSQMAEVIVYIIVILFMCIDINNVIQFSMLFITAGGILLTLVNNSHGQDTYYKVFAYLGKISFPLLCLHEPIRLIINMYVNNKNANRIAFYVISIVGSILIMNIVEKILNKKVMRI